MKQTQKAFVAATLSAAVALVAPFTSLAADAPVATPAAAVAQADLAQVAAKAQASIDKSVEWLRGQQQPDGGWQKKNDPPAVTALALRAMVSDPKVDAKSPAIKKGFEQLLSYQKPEGGIFKDLL